MKAVKIVQAAPGLEQLELSIEEQDIPVAWSNECVIKVYYAAVNPSDAAAALGMFPKAVWPRHPGRDFAGKLIHGPAELIGKSVWGTGGDIGIRKNGSHASFLVIPANAFSEIPSTISMPEAASVGVPFITAYDGLKRAGGIKSDQWILIFGINGKVGQAAAQLATASGANVIGVDRASTNYIGHASKPVTVCNSNNENWLKEVLELTKGHGADIVYNTVGGPYFEAANAAMAHGGTQIFIADRAKQAVPFSIFQFYRKQLTYVGVDTQELDVVQCAAILNELKDGFENGKLKPFPIEDHQIFPISRALEAYQQTFNGSREKIVLQIADQ